LQAIDKSLGLRLSSLRMTLERAIEYIDIDEYVEVTIIAFAQAHPRWNRTEARHHGGRLVRLTNDDFLDAFWLSFVSSRLSHFFLIKSRKILDISS